MFKRKKIEKPETAPDAPKKMVRVTAFVTLSVAATESEKEWLVRIAEMVSSNSRNVIAGSTTSLNGHTIEAGVRYV